MRPEDLRNDFGDLCFCGTWTTWFWSTLCFLILSSSTLGCQNFLGVWFHVGVRMWAWRAGPYDSKYCKILTWGGSSLSKRRFRMSFFGKKGVQKLSKKCIFFFCIFANLQDSLGNAPKILRKSSEILGNSRNFSAFGARLKDFNAFWSLARGF